MKISYLANSVITAAGLFDLTYHNICHFCRSLVYPNECLTSNPSCLLRHMVHRTQSHGSHRDTSCRHPSDMPTRKMSTPGTCSVPFPRHRARLPPRYIGRDVRGTTWNRFSGSDSQSIILLKDFNFKVKGGFERRDWMICANGAVYAMLILDYMPRGGKLDG